VNINTQVECEVVIYVIQMQGHQSGEPPEYMKKSISLESSTRGNWNHKSCTRKFCENESLHIEFLFFGYLLLCNQPTHTSKQNKN